jgi:hypothetical protein
MNNPTGETTFEVDGRLNLKGHAEFTGVRHRVDGPPSSGLRFCGVDIEFTNPIEADRFAQAARVMADQLRLAIERPLIVREPKETIR